MTTDYLLRNAAPADASAPAESPAVPPVVQLIQPQKKAPPAPLVVGYILLTLGLIVWLGLVLLSVIFPVSVHRGDTFVSGVNGFLLAYDLHTVYYLSLLCVLLGAVVIAVYLLLRWWFNRRKDSASNP